MCVFSYLEEAAGVLVTQVNIDHLQQCLDFFIAHLIVVVLVGPTQVRMDPGDNTIIVKEEAARAEHVQRLVVFQRYGVLKHRSNLVLPIDALC